MRSGHTPHPGPGLCTLSVRPPGTHHAAGAPRDDTVVLPALDGGPPVAAREGDAPATTVGVPEVPALADLAGPGRPPVDLVAAAAPVREHGDGRRGRSGRRPSRSMRARADEMASLLDRAAPGPAVRRRLTSLPAAVAVAGAFAVGGVGLVLGLDARNAGQDLALPPMPSLPAEDPAPGVPLPGTGTDPDTATGATGAVPSAGSDTARGAQEARSRTRDAPETAAARGADPSGADRATPDDAEATTTRTPSATTTSRNPRSTSRPTTPDTTAPRATGARSVPRTDTDSADG